VTNALEIPHAERGLLLLADISGYSAFLDVVGIAHPEMTGQGGGPVPPAYPFLVSLLDVVGERIAPTWTPVQTEGDAVFAWAPAEPLRGAGERVVEEIGAAYEAFHERLEQVKVLQNHDCQACMVTRTLDLKFVVHEGTFVVQPLASRVHLAGPAVNLVHRLLKNSIAETWGTRAYLFVTDPAAELLGLPAGWGKPHRQQYPDVGDVAGTVMPLTVPSGAAAG
jgi:uncharacterized protein DUF2652